MIIIKTLNSRGDMNGLLKRPGSPTTSDSSKENIDEEDNNNMSGLTRWGKGMVAMKMMIKQNDKWKYSHQQKLKRYINFPPQVPLPNLQEGLLKSGQRVQAPGGCAQQEQDWVPQDEQDHPQQRLHRWEGERGGGNASETAICEGETSRGGDAGELLKPSLKATVFQNLLFSAGFEPGSG